MYIWAVLFVIWFAFLFLDWHAKGVFVATGYPRRYGHGKSGKRAMTHYKENWRFWQRLLWIPIFKEKYEKIYREMAYLSYIHFLLMIATSVCFLVNVLLYPDVNFWVYEIVAYFLFSILIRFIHSNDVGKNAK